MTKYKYYFKKPRSEILKDILKILAASAIVYVASTSPYFTISLLRKYKTFKKYKKKRIYDHFYKLRKQGLIEINNKNHQIYIKLTEKGKKKAGWLQINDLKIKRPKKWDKKWRIVMFDISQLKKAHREAFRGKLKELGFIPLQKSVWVNPFKCCDEINLLRDFFGLTEKELIMVTAEDIGRDSQLKRDFKIEL